MSKKRKVDAAVTPPGQKIMTSFFQSIHRPASQRQASHAPAQAEPSSSKPPAKRKLDFSSSASVDVQQHSKPAPRLRPARSAELLGPPPDPSDPSDYQQRLLMLELDREAAKVVLHSADADADADNPDSHADGKLQPRQLSQEQRRVAECPPDIPLSVRAGAGSGKTHAMVRRALCLTELYGIDPSNILMLTFSVKATAELRDRVASAFTKSRHLPTIQTFHSLAFSWVSRCWRACGLGRRPSPLATPSQQRELMAWTLKARLDELRLERCRTMLALKGASWDDVVNTVKDRYPALHELAAEEAEATVREQEPKDMETERERIDDELAQVRESALRLGCYLGLIRLKLEKTADDLEPRWRGDKSQCDMYRELIRRARLGGHSPSDYLPDDAKVWMLYENMQIETGQIDFDMMLTLFIKLLQRSETVAHRFRERYTHVVVDEYQDNSEVQAEMLNGIVTAGRVTVVGDDDQCIYEFRGASPGNFARLRERYSSSVGGDTVAGLPLREEVLSENYRSSANVLRVGRRFLEGCIRRDHKDLRSTRSDGDPVELWKCMNPVSQARQIAENVKRRHDGDGVPWEQMACLFRCFQMGSLGQLHLDLQCELAKRNIPFNVVGGISFFERESVRDLMAYLNLAITGTQDDDAFARVLNKPSRRLPKNVLEKIREHRSSINAVSGETETRNTISLEEAAARMARTGVGLSASQCEALKGFFKLIIYLRIEALRKPLAELLRIIWQRSGLDEMHERKATKKKEKNFKGTSIRHIQVNPPKRNESKDDEVGEDIEVGGDSRRGVSSFQALHETHFSERRPKFCPFEVKIVFQLAETHVNEWRAREEQLATNESNVPSLFDLSRQCVIHFMSKEQIPPEYLGLPEHLLDELFLTEGVGLPVIRSFAAEVALKMAVSNEDAEKEVSGLCISTIHRAKGLEWTDVYVPYFNQGFMPTNFREEAQLEAQRHRESCSARSGRTCDQSCKALAERDTVRRGIPKERHADEERRLAHVAATRAKDRLVFTSLSSFARSRQDSPEPSSFECELLQLPSSVFSISKRLTENRQS